MIRVCIDDFALKRRLRYGTILINIDTRQAIDIFESRETADIAEWLASYPDIEIVSRDGSLQYAAAIKRAHSKALQVSDRFHLIEKLTRSAKDHITRIMGSHFCIPGCNSNSVYKGGYWDAAYDIKPDIREKQHLATLRKKNALTSAIRELFNAGISKLQIAKSLGIGRMTVYRHLREDFTAVPKTWGTKKPGKINPYLDTVNAMLGKSCKFKEIERAIKELGYRGSASTIRCYALRQRRIIQRISSDISENSEIIERKWVIRLLYHPLEKVKGITEEQIARVISEFPIIGSIYDLVRSFKEIIFGKKPKLIEEWIERAIALGIDGISGFANGVKRDLDAVKNAIRFDYSNGIAEGKINKLKLIKRIMYGRASFELLRNKLLLGEQLSRIN